MQKIKLVKQDVKNIGHVNSYKDIEKIARLCYRSEDKINENSYLKFIKMLLKNGHLSVLEHLNIIFIYEWDDEYEYGKELFNSPFIEISIFDDNKYLVSGSLRVIYEYCMENMYYNLFKKIVSHLKNFDEIFKNIIQCDMKEKLLKISCQYESLSLDEYFLNYIKIKILSNDDILKNKIKIENEEGFNYLVERHLAHTFYVTCNRGISHEYVRHRWTHAITQESTRFVKYDEVEMILPLWFYQIDKKNKKQFKIWKKSCKQDANTYKKLLEMGFTPQQARDNLPHSLKTSLYSTMSLKQWKHFLKMRKSKKAHPLIYEIAEKIFNFLKIEYPDVF